jgi:hypothetical protein
MVEHGSLAEAPLWGVSAEFSDGAAALAAAGALRAHLRERIEIYSPVPLSDAQTALDLPSRPVHPLAVAAVLVGFAAMMGMCLYATGFDYVFDIANRPRFSWPYFVIPSFSFGMLCGTLVVLLTMLLQNRLPRLNHPAFNIPGFDQASVDRCFVVIEARTEDFNPRAIEAAFWRLPDPPLQVNAVPR